jgi:flavin reductase (DIM6/NTAB) family NADH-FMN oxidoreductase RutF
MSLDTRTFRQTLGSFASGVTVVTTLAADTGEPVGVTVNAFSSVSLEPPLVLFCLGHQSLSLEAFKASGRFGVNMLSEHQRDHSIRFSSHGGDKWQGVGWSGGDSGVPLLAGCIAALECTLVQTVEGGDHTIFIGRVEHLRCQEGGQPLIYFRGGYLDPGR